MKRRIVKFLDMLLFGARYDDNRPANTRRRSLRRSLFGIMLVLTMIPLLASVTLSFSRYRALLNEEVTINTKWSAESARQTIEAYVDRLKASILIISRAYSKEELVDQQTLAEVFELLKSEHPGIVDLSIIDSNGVQLAYAGPFDLAGKNYADQDWFKKAISKEIHVSDVFLGYRKIPHFVVSVTKRNAGGTWLVRASVNTKTLDQFLERVNSKVIDDIVLVSSNGAVQTSLNKKIPMFESITIPSCIMSSDNVEMFHEKHGGMHIMRAYGIINGTPWVLILDQQDYARRKHWVTFTGQLTLIIVICVLLTGFIIARVAGFLARRIVEAEQTMETALSQTEHTNRLAAIGRLAGGVAHEINNPLAIINEKAGLLMDILEISEDFPRREAFVKHLSLLQKAVIRARDITHRLLGFARRTEEKHERLSIDYIIREVLSFIEKEATYRNIAIDLQMDDGLPEIMGDIGQLQQIFLNILNNAIDAVPESGLIRIRCTSSEGKVLAEISDNGSGMDPAVMHKIFEPFFTTKADTEKHGTGLGLFITYGLVKKLGGEITVESLPGDGTTFRLSFPSV